MYYGLTLFSGSLISVMIAMNGWLSAQYGVTAANVITHIVGLAVISFIVLVKRDRPFAGRLPPVLYLGGVMGVAITICQNLAFGGISVSAILALSLLGQSAAGLIVDQFGLIGMPVRRFRARKLRGLFLVLCGIACMLRTFRLLPVLAATLSGVGLVISRTINANLSERTNCRIGTFFNYLTGLLTAVPVALLLGQSEPAFVSLAVSPNPLIYLGGALGVAVVFLSNFCVKRISAFMLTLCQFTGQVFTGLLMDRLIDGSFSLPNLLGGVLVGAGLVLNTLVDRRA